MGVNTKIAEILWKEEELRSKGKSKIPDGRLELAVQTVLIVWLHFGSCSANAHYLLLVCDIVRWHEFSIYIGWRSIFDFL